MPIAQNAPSLKTIAFLPADVALAAPPPYQPEPTPVQPGYRDNPVEDRADGGAMAEILAAAQRTDVWRLCDLAGGRLSFREERLLIDSAFDRIGDDYDRYQVLDRLAGNGQLTQLGREHLWNSLNRLGKPGFRRRVAEALRWNYPC